MNPLTSLSVNGKPLLHKGFRSNGGCMATNPASVPDSAETPRLRIISFGFGHGLAPAATLCLDLRDWFRDPHVSPELRRMTGRDHAVVAHVLSMPGAVAYIDKIFNAVAELVHLNCGTVVLAAGCVGGRHRSVVFADQLFLRAWAVGWIAAVFHRDVDQDVLIERRAAA